MKTLVARLPLLVALASAVALTMGHPLLATSRDSPSSQSARSQYCGNGPNTVAGTRFDRRTTLTPRVQPIPCPRCGIAWCQPGTQTYLIIKTGWAASNAWFLRDLVAAALTTAGHYLANGGDRVMSSAVGTSFHTQEGLVMTVANANNHQLTWGVFSGAMEALDGFIRENGGFVSATFDVYDGQNQVGTGKIH